MFCLRESIIRYLNFLYLIPETFSEIICKNVDKFVNIYELYDKNVSFGLPETTHELQNLLLKNLDMTMTLRMNSEIIDDKCYKYSDFSHEFYYSLTPTKFIYDDKKVLEIKISHSIIAFHSSKDVIDLINKYESKFESIHAEVLWILVLLLCESKNSIEETKDFIKLVEDNIEKFDKYKDFKLNIDNASLASMGDYVILPLLTFAKQIPKEYHSGIIHDCVNRFANDLNAAYKKNVALYIEPIKPPHPMPDSYCRTIDCNNNRTTVCFPYLNFNLNPTNPINNCNLSCYSPESADNANIDDFSREIMDSINSNFKFAEERYNMENIDNIEKYAIINTGSFIMVHKELFNSSDLEKSLSNSEPCEKYVINQHLFPHVSPSIGCYY